MHNTSGLIFDNNVVESNSAVTRSNAAFGGGVYVQLYDSANAALSNSTFSDNTASETNNGEAWGAGAAFVLASNAQLSFSNNVVSANAAEAATLGEGRSSGVFVDANCPIGCAISFSADLFDQNIGGFDGQLEIYQDSMSGSSSLLLRD